MCVSPRIQAPERTAQHRTVDIWADGFVFQVKGLSPSTGMLTAGVLSKDMDVRVVSYEDLASPCVDGIYRTPG